MKNGHDGQYTALNIQLYLLLGRIHPAVLVLHPPKNKGY